MKFYIKCCLDLVVEVSQHTGDVNKRSTVSRYTASQLLKGISFGNDDKTNVTLVACERSYVILLMNIF